MTDISIAGVTLEVLVEHQGKPASFINVKGRAYEITLTVKTNSHLIDIRNIFVITFSQLEYKFYQGPSIERREYSLQL